MGSHLMLGFKHTSVKFENENHLFFPIFLLVNSIYGTPLKDQNSKEATEEFETYVKDLYKRDAPGYGWSQRDQDDLGQAFESLSHGWRVTKRDQGDLDQGFLGRL